MNNRGFTLVEVIAVILILSILVIITTPVFTTISKNIRTKNYESKKNTIEKEVLAYAEKYFKDDIYNGTTNKCYYFSVKYLIQNGIIKSDDAKEEYIENDVTNEKYTNSYYYVVVYYDAANLKLKASANNSASVNSTATSFNGVSCSTNKKL